MHRQIVEKLFQLTALPCSSQAVQAAWYTFLTLKALNAGLHFKHEAYRNEQEYRFLEAHTIDQPVPGVKLRYRPNSFIKYREFNWKSLAPGALKEIAIGPAADSRQASQFAKDCLNLFYPGTVKVTHSEIPYRGV